MEKMGALYQTADWRIEKHVPVIDCPDAVDADEVFNVKVSIGEEVAHPNTTEHHIRWIRLYFRPEGDKFAYEVGNYEFAAHGESTDGPDTGPVLHLSCSHCGIEDQKSRDPVCIFVLQYPPPLGKGQDHKGKVVKNRGEMKVV
jgi:superoxide reductase